MKQQSALEALQDKIEKEFEEYKNWLLLQPPEKILGSAYEYVTKADFVEAVSVVGLNEKQVQALLEHESPLSLLYDRYLKWDPFAIEDLGEVIKSEANHILREAFVQEERKKASLQEKNDK